MSRHFTYCRICQASCGLEVEVEDDRVVMLRGDRHDPFSRGFTCAKGRRIGDLHRGPGRLLQTLRRGADGALHPIATERALDEVAERLGAIRDRHGADSIAVFIGTQTYFAALTLPVLLAWFRALGSRKLFGTMTIDQSAKWVRDARLGRWAGGVQRFADSDVWMLFGTNPLVSLQGGPNLTGFPTSDPLRRLRQAQARGLRLIVVDPRRTETAAHADLHLRPLPGRDPLIAAAMLHVIFREGLFDREFCATYAEHVDELRRAVEPITPGVAAEAADVPVDDLVRAARLFGAAPRGMATGGTGPDMSPHSNLAEHLLGCLNVVCGRFPRAGERVPITNALSRMPAPRAEVVPPTREFERGYKSRIRGIGTLYGQLPSGILADEILEPGDDRVRALVVSAGNPAAAIPDQVKTVRALRSLDLLVTIDSRLSETARLADYVLAPALAFERHDHTGLMEPFSDPPILRVAEPILTRPPDVLEDWEVFWGLAARLDLPLSFGSFRAGETKPSSEELLALTASAGRTSLADLREHPHGVMIEPEVAEVLPATAEGASHRFALFPADVASELESAVTAMTNPRSGARPFLLVNRRRKDTMNTLGRDVPGLVKGGINPLFVNPDDFAALGLDPGAIVRVASEHGAVEAVAEPDPTLRRGVVSMTHCFGGLPDDERPVREIGTNPARLVSTDVGTESINNMPTMSGLPVAVRRLDAVG